MDLADIDNAIAHAQDVRNHFEVALLLNVKRLRGQIMKKFHGDVRPLSHDTRYMDGGFVGNIDDAIAQARAARIYPQSACAKVYDAAGQLLSRDRVALLQHLNLVPL